MSYNLLSPAFSSPSKEFEDIKDKNRIMNGKFNMNGNGNGNGNGYINGNINGNVNMNEYHGSNINLNKPNYQNFNPHDQRSYNNSHQSIATDKPSYPQLNQYISPNTTTSPIYQEKMELFYQSTPKKNDYYLPDLEYQPLNHFKPHSIHQNLNSPRTDPKYYKSIDPKAYTKKEITINDDNIGDTLDKSLNSSSTSTSSFINQDDISANNSISNLKANTKTVRKKSKNELPFDLNSHDKPPYSYATLIGISILSNPDKKLTLSQIYYWISSTFKYYKREDVGWQNSIRHNLSLNKAFLKGEKSKDGKGHYWIINDGFEELFLKKNFNNLLKINNNNNNNTNNHDKSKLPSSPIEPVELPPIVSKREDSQKRLGDVEDEDDDEDEEDENDADMTRILEPPTKRQKLGDPFWELPKSLPEITVLNPQTSPPQLARRNLTYSSSFSCNSNLEFSPIRSSETGPLLEPITPGKNLLSVIQPNNLLKPSLVHTTYPNINHLQKTPKSIKTPLKNSKTPQSSIIRKLWNSPSYLEEFYSPLMTHAHHINSYDDDDMILRNLYPSPNILKKFNNNIPLKSLSKNLLNDLSNFDNNKLQDKLKHVDNGENGENVKDSKAENTDED